MGKYLGVASAITLPKTASALAASRTTETSSQAGGVVGGGTRAARLATGAIDWGDPTLEGAAIRAGSSVNNQAKKGKGKGKAAGGGFGDFSGW